MFLSLIFYFPVPAHAAIAVAEGAAEISSTSNVETYNFPSVTLSGNAVIVVIAFVRGTNDAGEITNVSGDALTWTKKTSALWPTGDNSHSVYVFWAKTPASPQASVYQVNVTGDAGTGCGAVMFQFTGADLVTADPIKQAVISDGGTRGSADANGTFGTALGTNNGMRLRGKVRYRVLISRPRLRAGPK